MHHPQKPPLFTMNPLARLLIVAALLVALAMGVGAWLVRESVGASARQTRMLALGGSIEGLHVLRDIRIEIESAYRGALLAGSSRAIDQVRAASTRWHTAFAATQRALPAEDAISAELDTLKTSQSAYFNQLEGLLQNFRSGGTLNDLDAPTSGSQANQAYERLERQLAEENRSLAQTQVRQNGRMQSGALILLALLIGFACVAGWAVRKLQLQLRASQQQLARESFRDPLTGLANRRYLHAWLQAQVSTASRMGDSFHVLYLDLDGFERINEQYGQLAGDALLVAAGERLKVTTRGGDFVARHGEDEFVIVFSCEPDSREIGRFAARLIRSLAKPMVEGVPGGILSASIGVANFPTDGQTADDLVAAARKAMMQAKRSGKACYAYRRESAPEDAPHIWEVSRF